MSEPAVHSTDAGNGQHYDEDACSADHRHYCAGNHCWTWRVYKVHAMIQIIHLWNVTTLSLNLEELRKSLVGKTLLSITLIMLELTHSGWPRINEFDIVVVTVDMRHYLFVHCSQSTLISAYSNICSRSNNSNNINNKMLSYRRESYQVLGSYSFRQK